MKKRNTHRTRKVIDGFRMKKQLHGGFKIVEYSHFEKNGYAITEIRKRTLYKDLPMTDAEAKLYELELLL